MPRPPKRQHVSGGDSKANTPAEDGVVADDNPDLSVVRSSSNTAFRSRRGRGGRGGGLPVALSRAALPSRASTRSRSPVPHSSGRRSSGRGVGRATTTTTTTVAAHHPDDDDEPRGEAEVVVIVPPPPPPARGGKWYGKGVDADPKDPNDDGDEDGNDVNAEAEEEEDEDEDEDEDPEGGEDDAGGDRCTAAAEESAAAVLRPLVLLGQRPRGTYECDYCGTDLTRTPRIRCAVCPDFDLCLECFATEDHEHMARYKREEEAQRRRDAARIAGLTLDDPANDGAKTGAATGAGEASSSSSAAAAAAAGGGKQKTGGRGSKGGGKDCGGADGGAGAGGMGEGAVGDDAIGSYVGGIWVPYFRHEGDHGYIVADSARYVMFPSFRGVVGSVAATAAAAAAATDEGRDSEEAKEEGGAGGEDGGGGVVPSSGDAANAAAEIMGQWEEKGAVAEELDGVSEEEGGGVVPSSGDAANADVIMVQGEEKGAAAEDLDGNSEDGGGGVVPSSGDAANADVIMVQGEEKDAAAEELDGVCAEGAFAEADSDAANDPGRTKTEDVGERPSIIAGATSDKCDGDEAESKADEEMEGRDRSNNGKAAVAHADASADGHDVDRKRESRPQRYRVVDETKNAWTAEEDLRLLDGILVCGLGNWPDIAEHVIGSGGGEGGGGGSGVGDGSNSGGKTDKQCMERYLDDFMGRYGYILPPYTMVPEPEEEGGGGGDDREGDSKSGAALDGPDCDGAVRKRPRRSVSSAVPEDDDSAPGFRRTKFQVVPTEELEECKDLWPHPYIPPNARMGDEVARDLWYRSEQYFVRQTTGAASKVDAEAIRTEFIERRAQNLAGYEAKVLPPRLEDMKQLPGAELAGYMPRRGDFDMEWDNDAEKTIAEMEFSSDDTKADRELKLDVLRIFNTKLDERERRKQFIVDHGLLNYRENQEKLWRMPPDERHLVQRMRLFARFHSREEHEAFVNKIIEAKRLRKEIAKLQMYRRMGITSLADAEKYEMDKVRRELHRDAWIKKEEQKRKAAEEAVRAARENATVLMPAPPPVPAPVSKLEGPVGVEANQSLQVWRQFKRFKKNGSESKSSGNLDNETAKFVIRDKPGYELLSKKEVVLCKRLRLHPQKYLDVKRALISESLAQGIWSPIASAPKQNRSIFKVDVTQRDNIIDFVLEAGWIPTRPSIID